jgi:glutamate dehydrogenase
MTIFLKHASDNTKRIYQQMLKKAALQRGPLVESFTCDPSPEKRMVICFRSGETSRFFAALTDLYHSHGMVTTKKYLEQFANGFTCISLYMFRPEKNLEVLQGYEESIRYMEQEINLIYVLSVPEFQPLLQTGVLSAEECVYAYVGYKFAFQFLNRMGSEYYALRSFLDMKNEQHAALMAALRRRLTDLTFTEASILESITEQPAMVKLLYSDFAYYHRPTGSLHELRGSEAEARKEEILSAIKKNLATEQLQQIFTMLLTFNRNVLKTNFYKVGKVALSFRLDPQFLDAQEYPARPFGIFFLIGEEFHGFHVRFCDVARGGIRIIRSRDAEAYATNVKHLFDECYGLANTQEKKNKDIPEGGSKGVVLLNTKCQSSELARMAFEKYVDSLLDLLLNNDAASAGIVDHYQHPEILFLGPDEGTADVMDWASERARERGARFWKAFTTGKSRAMGGIPHDLYGMTTRSIHQYVLGILKKVGLQENQITKFQTGGPDGDLGSNEIKISTDKTIAIVDGSGVLYDGDGLNRAELIRLANARVMSREFDRSKLGPTGFFVDINDRDVKLPDGSIVENGLNFRNEFHLNPLSSAVLFVPCGGRPEAVNISNVDKFFVTVKKSGTSGGISRLEDKEKEKEKEKERVPRFKYIVEGANLFFTQEARLILEESGVIIFKDSSANKGGVTSSSLEVLAALALDDAEFEQHMAVKTNSETGEISIPPFYEAYVKDVYKTIENNAELEFLCIWNEHQRTGLPRSVIGDLVSTKINSLNDAVQNSVLWNNMRLRKLVLSEACPSVLLETVGIDKLVKRVPENYLKAIFGSYLASRYVYKYGLETKEFDFFDFVQPYFDKLHSTPASSN